MTLPPPLPPLPSFANPHPEMYMDRIYLGKRRYRSTPFGKCGLLIVIENNSNDNYLKLTLFEGDSQNVAENTTATKFAPLGYARDKINFKDIAEIS